LTSSASPQSQPSKRSVTYSPEHGWLPPFPRAAAFTAEADAMHALLVTRADQLMACLEESEGAIEAFAGIADDIADIKQTMATKDEVIALHTQVTGVETDIKTMKGYKLATRVADLEEEVFGEARG
jgi:hypothetical protein